ncbi:MAG: hypothetical protein II670_01190, partial [Alphaproteobacteria bacterium]|nr:hypothetical protein [Alphaproteobacteria bacterium]
MFLIIASLCITSIASGQVEEIRHKIDSCRTILEKKTGNTKVLQEQVKNYEMLDTLLSEDLKKNDTLINKQEEYISGLEVMIGGLEEIERKYSQYKWVEWISREDTTVFAFPWGEYRIPEWARGQVVKYEKIAELRKTMSEIEKIVEATKKDHRDFPDDDM